MKRAALLLALALASLSSLSRAQSAVQTCEYSFHLTVTTGTCTFGLNLTAGNWVIIWETYGIGFGNPQVPVSSAGLSYTCYGGGSSNVQIGDVTTSYQSFCLAFTGGYAGPESVTFNGNTFSDFLYIAGVEESIPGKTFERTSFTTQNGAGATATQNISTFYTSGSLFVIFAWAGKQAASTPNPTLSAAGFTTDFNNNNAIPQTSFGCCATSALGLIIGHIAFSGNGSKSGTASSGGIAAQQWISDAFTFGTTGAFSGGGEKKRRIIN